PARRAAAAVHGRSVPAVCAPSAGAASPLARHTPLPYDPGSRLHRQRWAVAACGRTFAPPTARSLPAFAGLSRRAGTGGLGLLWLGHGRPRQAPTLLFRHHLVLVAGAVSGVLFRPDDGEFPARPRARLSRLVRRAPSHPVRQSSQRGAGTPRRPDSFQPAAAGTGRSLSLRATSLPSTSGKSKGPRGKGHPVCTRFVLGRPRVSRPWRIAIARRFCGAMKS